MKYKILLIIFAISLILSSILAFIPTQDICGEETSSCSIVQNSKYKDTLGISNSILGIIAYSILIIITISQMHNPKQKTKKLLTIILAISSLGALYFIAIQTFIIKALCPYCMIIDTLTILALIILITRRK